MGSQNEAVIEALETRGFRYVGRDAQRWLSFLGYLNTSEGEHDCELVVDPEFYELPRVRLLSVPDALLPIAPHIGGNGSICYLTKNTVVLDFFDPVGQTLRCVDEAQSVLGKVLRKEMVEDLTEEFLSTGTRASAFSMFRSPSSVRCQAFACSDAPGNGFPSYLMTLGPLL